VKIALKHPVGPVRLSNQALLFKRQSALKWKHSHQLSDTLTAVFRENVSGKYFSNDIFWIFRIHVILGFTFQDLYPIYRVSIESLYIFCCYAHHELICR
jgi:hypothetical protein